MKFKTKVFLYSITIIYVYFIIGPLKSPSPYRNNIFLHIIYFVIIVGILIISRLNKR